MITVELTRDEADMLLAALSAFRISLHGEASPPATQYRNESRALTRKIRDAIAEES